MRCWWYVVALAVIAPLSGEILNRSTSISEITSLAVVVAWLLPYSLLIVVLAFLTERAPLPGNVLVLLPVAGLVIEGILVASFFNPAFTDLSVLSNVGVFGGVQWPWTLSLLASHAMVSFLIPLELASFFRCRCKQLSGITAAIAATALAALVFTLVIKDGIPYGFGRMATLVVMAALIVIFFVVRVPEPRQESVPGGMFFALGVLFVPLNWLSSFFLAHQPVVLILAAQAVFIGAYLLFLWAQWFNVQTPRSKRLFFVAGYLIPAAVVPTWLGRHTLAHDPVGLATIALVAALLVVAWRSSGLHGAGTE